MDIQVKPLTIEHAWDAHQLYLNCGFNEIKEQKVFQINV
jgi:hypothetical protein